MSLFSSSNLLSALRVKFIAAGAAAALSFSTMASATSFTNGNFTATTSTNGSGITNNGELYDTVSGQGLINLTGWNSTGYNFVAAQGTLDGPGSKADSGGYLKMWGPANGSANGLSATPPFSGNIIESDGAYDVGPLTQSISGLVAGYTYELSFYYAGAQQNPYQGSTSETWDVSFGNETIDTPTLMIPTKGFSGWQTDTLSFVADNTTDTLKFLAAGTPNGEPPFSLLGGVTLSDGVAPTPEMGSLGLLFTGLMTSAGMVRYRMNRRA